MRRTNLMNRLRSKSGEVTISTAALLLVIAIALSTIMTTAAVLDKKTTLDYMANEIARYVEVKGDTATAQTEFARLKEVVKLSNAKLIVDAKTIGVTSRIQLEDEFTAIVTCDTDIGVGTIVKIPIPLKSKATGRSEKYWK